MCWIGHRLYRAIGTSPADKQKKNAVAAANARYAATIDNDACSSLCFGNIFELNYLDRRRVNIAFR